MKKILVAFVLTYLLLLVGYHFDETYVLTATTTLALIPTTLIFLVVNLRKLRSKKGSYDLILFSCFALGISTVIAIGRIPLFNDYYDLGFFLVSLLLALTVGLLINRIPFQTGINGLIPLVVIFGMEVYQSNNFVTSSHFYRIDQQSHQILKSNGIMHSELRGFGPRTSDVILITKVKSPYANTIEIMDSYLQDAIGETGGYKYPHTMSRVVAPKRMIPNSLNEKWIPRVRSSILNDITNEQNQDKKKILSMIENQFYQEAYDNTVVELRLRIYSAQNQLLTLSLIK